MAVGDPTGADLVVGTTDGDTLTTDADNPEERQITFSSSVELTSGVKYAIVVRAIDAVGSGDAARWDYLNPGAKANAVAVESFNSGSTWSAPDAGAGDLWFKTLAGVALRDNYTDPDFDLNPAGRWLYGINWVAQTFTASSTYTITSVKLNLWKEAGATPGTLTVSIKATVVAPGKATTPTPTDDEEDIKITGIDQLKLLQWEAPA